MSPLDLVQCRMVGLIANIAAWIREVCVGSTNWVDVRYKIGTQASQLW
jgi:hypothetical protein